MRVTELWKSSRTPEVMVGDAVPPSSHHTQAAAIGPYVLRSPQDKLQRVVRQVDGGHRRQESASLSLRWQVCYTLDCHNERN